MTEFRYSNVDREMEVYGYDSMVKSHCRMCHGGCGVLVYIKDGKVAKIAGDPDCPINHGTLCTKGPASAQLAYHPDRLIHPVKRVGPKASGKWDGFHGTKPWMPSEAESSNIRRNTDPNPSYSAMGQAAKTKP